MKDLKRKNKCIILIAYNSYLIICKDNFQEGFIEINQNKKNNMQLKIVNVDLYCKLSYNA